MVSPELDKRSGDTKSPVKRKRKDETKEGSELLQVKTTTRKPIYSWERTCPHCAKVISSKHGLAYHLENKVCQNKKTVKMITPLKPRPSLKLGQEGRTCPFCSKVSSTKYGLKYHIENRVCRKKERKSEVILKTKEAGEESKQDDNDERTATNPAKILLKPVFIENRTRTCPSCSKVIADKTSPQYQVDSCVCKNGVVQDATIQESVSDRTCPYCFTIIATKLGLKCHIENRLCHKYQRSSEPPIMEGELADKVDTYFDAASASTNAPSTLVKGRGPDDDLTCPHCSQVMASQLGLQYHLQRFVCRKEKETLETMVVAAHLKPSGNQGPVEDRTCPYCRKIISRKVGLQNHIDNFMCRKDQGKSSVNRLPINSNNNLLDVDNNDKCDDLETKNYSYESLLDAAKPILNTVASTAMAAPIMALLQSLARIVQDGDTTYFLDKDCAALLRQFSEDSGQSQVAYPKVATSNTASKLPATLSCRFCHSPSCPGIQACIHLKKLGSFLPTEEALTLVQKIDSKTMVPRALATTAVIRPFSIFAKWVVLHEVVGLTSTEKLARVTLLGQSGSPLEGYVQVLMIWNVAVRWILQNANSFIKGIDLDD